jgi:hypothetical protein
MGAHSAVAALDACSAPTSRQRQSRPVSLPACVPQKFCGPCPLSCSAARLLLSARLLLTMAGVDPAEAGEWNSDSAMAPDGLLMMWMLPCLDCMRSQHLPMQCEPALHCRCIRCCKIIDSASHASMHYQCIVTRQSRSAEAARATPAYTLAQSQVTCPTCSCCEWHGCFAEPAAVRIAQTSGKSACTPPIAALTAGGLPKLLKGAGQAGLRGTGRTTATLANTSCCSPSCC